MFRHPASRVLSSWSQVGASYAADAISFAKRVEGLAVKMVAGQETFPYKQCCCNTKIIPNTQLAIRRLSKFRFVGLVEEYALSVCLFHAMLGGDCLTVEFVNMRPSTRHRTSLAEDIDLLGGYQDSFDLQLYAAVKKIFWTNVRKYNVTRAACASQICPAASSHFAPKNPLNS